MTLFGLTDFILYLAVTGAFGGAWYIAERQDLRSLALRVTLIVTFFMVLVFAIANLYVWLLLVL